MNNFVWWSPKKYSVQLVKKSPYTCSYKIAALDYVYGPQKLYSHGTIEIDHEQQKLDMVVFPQHGSSQGSGQTHILSGGERSYSTVAFLHALWQVMEYPFYFLDEFDVFMDKVNRRTVMDILIAHATEHSDLQFVFLTPQDISGIVENVNVSVYKMPDPDRKSINA